MKINRAWHEQNKMPEHPTVDERMRWHIAHAQHCACRSMSEKLKAEIEIWKKDKRI